MHRRRRPRSVLRPTVSWKVTNTGRRPGRQAPVGGPLGSAKTARPADLHGRHAHHHRHGDHRYGRRRRSTSPSAIRLRHRRRPGPVRSTTRRAPSSPSPHDRRLGGVGQSIAPPGGRHLHRQGRGLLRPGRFHRRTPTGTCSSPPRSATVAVDGTTRGEDRHRRVGRPSPAPRSRPPRRLPRDVSSSAEVQLVNARGTGRGRGQRDDREGRAVADDGCRYRLSPTTGAGARYGSPYGHPPPSSSVRQPTVTRRSGCGRRAGRR
ncbi:hypothetical protein SHIRM173S_13367 [Streptomyces hirsutus]